jgi:hypothetical protein
VHDPVGLLKSRWGHVGGIPAFFKGSVPFLHPILRTHDAGKPSEFLAARVLGPAFLCLGPCTLVRVYIILPAGSGLVGVWEAGVEGRCREKRSKRLTLSFSLGLQ